jgi:hypothetical protein
MKESMTTIFPDVLIIGVGGGSGNIISDLVGWGIGIDTAVVDNTEQPAIDALLNEEIRTVFIVTCLGGEFGSSVAPQIAAECRKRKLKTIGVATLPFEFEGAVKAQRAKDAANELAKNCDSLNLVHNEIMLKGNQGIAVNEAFKDIDICIHEIVTKELYSVPVWLFGKSRRCLLKYWLKKCFGWLHKNDGALVCKSFKENDYKITSLCIDIVERKAKKIMGKEWFCHLGDQIKFLALWSTIVSELCDEGGLFLDCNEMVYDVLTISRISQIQSWLQYYEEVDYSKIDELENAHKASARICERRRELLSSLDCSHK